MKTNQHILKYKKVSERLLIVLILKGPRGRVKRGDRGKIDDFEIEDDIQVEDEAMDPNMELMENELGEPVIEDDTG